MNQRGTTNVLLAIIVGVLLFGQTSMVGVLKWLVLGTVALIAIVIVFRLAAWIVSGGIGAVREVVEEWKGDAPLGQKLASAGGLVMMPFLIWFGLTWLWLWWFETPDLKHAIFDTAAGKAWAVVAFALLGSAVIVLLTRGVFWLLDHRSELPARAWKAVLYWGIGLFAVVAFPINEFRHRRLEGSGIVGTVLGPAGMLVVGAAVSLATVGFSMVGVSAVLLALGVVE